MNINIPIHPEAVPWFLLVLILATLWVPAGVAFVGVGYIVVQAWCDAEE